MSGSLSFSGTPDASYPAPAGYEYSSGSNSQFKFSSAGNSIIAASSGTFSQLVEQSICVGECYVEAEIDWNSATSTNEAGFCCIDSDNNGWSVIMQGTTLKIREEGGDFADLASTIRSISGVNTHRTYFNQSTGVISVRENGTEILTHTFTGSLENLRLGLQHYRDASEGQRYLTLVTYTGGVTYFTKSVANIAAGGVTKTILGLRQKSAAAGIISGGSKTQFSFNQKSPGGILLAGGAKTVSAFRSKSVGELSSSGAAKLRLISKNVGVGLVSFSGVSKARFISSYFGVGASVVTGYSKASLQINTVTLSVISSGAFNFSGVAKLRSIYSQKSTSQLSASGFGVPRFAVRSASSGVIALGGLSREVYRFVGKSVGQFSANGFSKNRFVFKAASVSGGALSGASKIRQITSYIGVGAGVVGGYSKAALALGVASVSIVSVGNLVLAGKSQVTLLPAIDWFQNFSLTVYYKPADRRVKAIAEDRRISAVPLDRTVKFRF